MVLTASGAPTTPGAASHALDPSVFSSVYSQLRFAQYFQVAIVTILVYDARTYLHRLPVPFFIFAHLYWMPVPFSLDAGQGGNMCFAAARVCTSY